eukprot:647740-Rhodomonas_salina.2
MHIAVVRGSVPGTCSTRQTAGRTILSISTASRTLVVLQLGTASLSSTRIGYGRYQEYWYKLLHWHRANRGQIWHCQLYWHRAVRWRRAVYWRRAYCARVGCYQVRVALR